MVGSPPNQPKKAGSKRAKVSHSRSKPLTGKIVFLDIKNHAAETSLKQSLILLGAKVQSFLGPEVSFVVSEQAEAGANSPCATPASVSCPSVAGGTSPLSPSVGSANSAAPRHASRCDRMVTVARRNQRTQRGSQDHLALARKWNVPVHTLAKVAASIERLNKRLKQPQASRIRLKAPFIKFESVARDVKPSYGELGRWPSATLSGPPGSSPFSNHSPAATPATATAAAAVQPPAPAAPDDTPRAAAKDGTHAQNVRPSRLKPRMTRKAVGTGGHCELCCEAYDSLSAHLATEKHVKEAACTRNYAALDVLIASAPGLPAFADRKGKLGGARTRSMSGGKLYTPGENAGSGGKMFTPDNNVPRCNGTTAQRRHMNRRSQLALLSSEASSFMSRSAADCDPLADLITADGATRRIKRRSGSDTEPVTETQCHRVGKRRSQAEAFICDNREYYKFETPGSRLRCHGEIKHEPGLSPPSPPLSPPEDNKCAIYEPLHQKVWFSFECAPHSEPWLAAFRRQDDGREMYAPLPHSDPPFLLPYELPPPTFAGRGRGRRRRGGVGRPRKSPRKHASTLAILSTLAPRQRRSVGAAATAPAAAVAQPVRGESDADLLRLANSLDAILDLSGDDLDLDPVDAPPILSEPSVAELMQSVADVDTADESESQDWRRRKKKKRKNLTGWPNAKRAKPVAAGSQSEGSGTGGRRLRSAVVARRESPRKQRAAVV